MIETDRLILRSPVDADRPAIAAVNGDPRVGAWLSGVQTRAESDAMVDRILAMIAEHGFGFWAALVIADHFTQASYLLAAALFILSLQWLNTPKTARRGVLAGVAGMAAAISALASVAVPPVWPMSDHAVSGPMRIDPSMADRIAEDVIGRVERRVRIDRERRGV